MSLECQIMGCDECSTGKECQNDNCDYRICDGCALNILEHLDNKNIFSEFDCPACKRPISFNFNKKIYLFHIKKYIKKLFFVHFCPIFSIASLIWTCLCVGRVFMLLLSHMGFMKGKSTDFFDQFLIMSIMGWIILCLLGVVFFFICAIIISLFSAIYIFYKKIICYNNKKSEFISIN
jgi:hypothetical protein